MAAEQPRTLHPVVTLADTGASVVYGDHDLDPSAVQRRLEGFFALFQRETVGDERTQPDTA